MLNKRGLARAGVTDHAEDLSLADLNIDMVERDTLKRGACAVNMRQAPCSLSMVDNGISSLYCSYAK